MSLRRRTLATVLGVVLLTTAVVGGLVVRNRIATLTDLEVDDAVEHADAVVAALAAEADDLDRSVVDWAHWDDTLAYVRGEQPGYVASNLAGATLDGLGIDLLAIVGPDGLLRWGRVRPTDAAPGRSLPTALVTMLRPDGSLAPATRDPDDGVRGLLAVDGQPWQVAVRPISDSTGRTSGEGLLVMGRRPVPAQVAAAAEPFGVDVRFAAPATGGAGEDDVAVGDGRVTVQRALAGLDGRPALVVTTARASQVLDRGIGSMRSMVRMLVVVMVVAGIALAWQLDRRVVRRLGALGEQVRAARDDPGRRVVVRGDDEIGALARDLDRVFGALRSTQRTLEDRNRELEEAVALKDDLVSVVSHELRTPLTVVMGCGETLRQHGAELDEEIRTSLAERVVAQSRRLSRLVDDLLLLALSDRGELRPHRTPVALRSLVEEACRDLPEAGVVVEVPAALVAVVDEEHLRRVVWNLLSNAVKYGRAPVVVGAEVVGDHVELSVVDAGQGVPEAFRPRLFERFARADVGDARGSSGTGLGLSIVRDLCLANGGDVHLDPHTVGARFVVRLPAR